MHWCIVYSLVRSRTRLICLILRQHETKNWCEAGEAIQPGSLRPCHRKHRTCNFLRKDPTPPRLGQVCYVHWSHVQRGQSKKESISISRRTQRVWSFGSSWRHMLATSGRLKTAIHSDTTVAHGLARNWQPAIHARVQLLQSDLIGPGAPVTWFSIGNHVSI